MAFLSYAQWTAAVQGAGGFATVWPFSDKHQGAPAARYPSTLANNGLGGAPTDPLGTAALGQNAASGAYFYILAPSFTAINALVTTLETMETGLAPGLVTEAQTAGTALMSAAGSAFSAVSKAASNATKVGLLGIAAAILGIPEWFLILLLVVALYLIALGAGLVPPLKKVLK